MSAPEQDYRSFGRIRKLLKESSFGEYFKAPQSERPHIRQRRSEIYYNQYLIPQLQEEVGQAEEARKDKQHVAVDDFYQKWTEKTANQRIKRTKVWQKAKDRFRKKRLDQENLDLIAVGLAGLGRIKHTDMNAQIPEEVDAQVQWQARKVTAEVEQLYEEIGLEQLPPWTVGRQGIHWAGEVVQDRASTELKLGFRERAVAELFTGVNQLNRVIEELEPTVGTEILNTPDDKLEYQQRKAKKNLIGGRYALTAVEARLARATGDTRRMLQVLQDLATIFPLQPNRQRVQDIAQWAMKLAVFPRAEQQALGDRVKLFARAVLLQLYVATYRE